MALPGVPCGEQRQVEAGEQRLPAGDVLGVQLLDEVVGAHDEHGEPVGGGGDRLGVEHRRPGVSTIAHSRGVLGGAVPLHRVDERPDLVGRVDLGHDDRVRAGGAGGGEVGVVPLGAERR